MQKTDRALRGLFGSLYTKPRLGYPCGGYCLGGDHGRRGCMFNCITNRIWLCGQQHPYRNLIKLVPCGRIPWEIG